MDRREFVVRSSLALSVAVAAPFELRPARASQPAPTSVGRILVIMTSTGKVPGSDRPTGLWWSEFSEPYSIFQKAGFSIDVASIAGGPVPVDPRSGGENRAKRDSQAWTVSRATLPIEKVQIEPYAGIFLSGGHGTMWDFPDNAVLAKLIGDAVEAGVTVGSVCHGPAGLIGARRKDGQPLVTGRRVNGFTNAEESAAGMTNVVPFLLETRLRELGGIFENGSVFSAFAVRDGALISGQNPASSERAAHLVLEAIADQPRKLERAG